MMDPLIVGFARGQLRDFPGNPESVLDLVPVDAVVNALLMAIPHTHHGGGPPVYQAASGMENPLSLGQFQDYLIDYFSKTPLRRARVGEDSTLPRLTFPATKVFLRRLDGRYLKPLRFAKFLLFPMGGTQWGKKRRADLTSTISRLERLRNTAAIYGPYAENRSRFLSFNLRALRQSLSPQDRQAFPFKLSDMSWRAYVQDVHLPGIKRYLLRLPTAQERGMADRAERGPSGEGNPCSGEDGWDLPASCDGRDANVKPAWERAARLLDHTRALSLREAEAWTAASLGHRWLLAGSFFLIRQICRRRLGLLCMDSGHVPQRGPFILVANHTSHVDTGLLLTALGPLSGQTHPTAAADYWFHSPTLAWLLHSMLGGIPFDRHAANVPQALALAAQVLRNGHSLIFYPEGTRSADGTLGPFKSTVGLLALAAGVPILPAYIAGAGEALPKGKIRIRPGRVSVQFGQPIKIEPYLGRLDREPVAVVARGLAGDLHSAVALLSGKVGPERPTGVASPFRGIWKDPRTAKKNQNQRVGQDPYRAGPAKTD
jgi:1-acyl-sn-glycerol-3-phosphate acyltransferase